MIVMQSKKDFIAKYSIVKKEKPVVSGMDGLRALKVAKIIIDKIENSVYEFN